MVVDDHLELAIQQMMMGGPLDNRKQRIVEARKLVELVKSHEVIS